MTNDMYSLLLWCLLLFLCFHTFILTCLCCSFFLLPFSSLSLFYSSGFFFVVQSTLPSFNIFLSPLFHPVFSMTVKCCHSDKLTLPWCNVCVYDQSPVPTTSEADFGWGRGVGRFRTMVGLEFMLDLGSGVY